MPTRLIFVAAAGAILLAPPAFAHHPTAISGTGGAGPINTLSATTLDQGQSGFGAAYEFIHFVGDAALIAGAQLSGSHDHSIKTIESVALTYAYGVTNDLSTGHR
jgi:uncharacterized membrane protein